MTKPRLFGDTGAGVAHGGRSRAGCQLLAERALRDIGQILREGW